jgi:hypothetical protein
MTHLPYIAASYVLALGVPLFFAIGTAFRLRYAKRRLAVIDPRGTR